MQNIKGKTMGTTYSINYYDSLQRDVKPQIDSLLVAFNQSVSTYIPTSTISKFNQADSLITGDRHLMDVWFIAQTVADATGGAFDPTIMPLVNFYGFGYKKRNEIDTTKLDSIRQYIGYRKVNAVENYLIKAHPKTELDLSAVAKGYGVDLVAGYLSQQGIKSYFVEIGGEIRTKGKKANDSSWVVGVEKPNEDASNRSLQTRIPLNNMSMATSGNYRNFYEVDGKKMVHTINPKTAKPEQNNLLSATVLHQSCAMADAYATAFMVMGFEKSKYFLEQNPAQKLQAYFIYLDENNQTQVWDGLIKQ